MKKILVSLSDATHQKLKHQAREGREFKHSMQDLSELGILLVLAETGEVLTPEGAQKLGASDRVVALFRRILAGEAW